METQRTWTKAEILAGLENPNWQLRALEILHSFQTRAEREARTTHEDNKIGFTAFDADILSSFAEQYATRQSLSPKQMVILNKRIKKYAGQLARLASARLVA